MFETLMVPVDETAESERALPVAAAIAMATGARIDLITIDDPNTDRWAMTRYHERLWDQLPPGVIGSGTVTLTEEPVATELARCYGQRPTSLLVLATRAPGAVRELLSGGSVGDEVVQATSRPVLLVGPAWTETAAASTTTAAVAALDGTELDAATAETAVNWSLAVQCPLTVVRVLASGEAADVEAATDQLWERAAAARGRGTHATSLLLHSPDAGEAILQELRHRTGVVVVGTHRRGAVGRLAHGSTGFWLVHRSPLPVLIAAAQAREP
jgi:nucleotide-binding universal stress UspA family protein